MFLGRHILVRARSFVFVFNSVKCDPVAMSPTQIIIIIFLYFPSKSVVSVSIHYSFIYFCQHFVFVSQQLASVTFSAHTDRACRLATSEPVNVGVCLMSSAHSVTSVNRTTGSWPAGRVASRVTATCTDPTIVNATRLDLNFSLCYQHSGSIISSNDWLWA